MALVSELQSAATSPEITCTELLRKALVVARKLNLDDFTSWIQKELRGYAESDAANLPPYRKISCEVIGINPVRGPVPVYIQDKEFREMLETHLLFISVPSIEDLIEEVRRAPGSRMAIPVPLELMTLIYSMFETNAQFPLQLATTANQLNRVTSEVRNIILEWSLDLEGKGIIGEGMTFSEKEQSVAKNEFHIETFVQNMSGSQIQSKANGSYQDMGPA